MTVENFWVAVISFGGDGRYGLMTNSDGTIRAFTSEYDALHYFEDVYRAAHARPGSWSASACMDFIQNHPAIVHFDSVEDIVPLVENPENCTLLRRGTMLVVELKTAEGKALHDSGRVPRLI